MLPAPQRSFAIGVDSRPFRLASPWRKYQQFPHQTTLAAMYRAIQIGPDPEQGAERPGDDSPSPTSTKPKLVSRRGQITAIACVPCKRRKSKVCTYPSLCSVLLYRLTDGSVSGTYSVMAHVQSATPAPLRHPHADTIWKRTRGGKPA